MDVLQKIRDAGFRLWADGDDLIVSPSSKLTDEQRAYLKARKAAVIEHLKREAPLGSMSPDYSESAEDKAAVIQDLIDRLTESERRFKASEKSWFDVLQKLEMVRAELVEAREPIEFLEQVSGHLIEHSEDLIMQARELKVSLAIEKAYNRMWTLRIHNPASGLSEADIRLLLQLCHPDKHNGSAASERAAQLLLGLREARAG